MLDPPSWPVRPSFSSNSTVLTPFVKAWWRLPLSGWCRLRGGRGRCIHHGANQAGPAPRRVGRSARDGRPLTRTPHSNGTAAGKKARDKYTPVVVPSTCPSQQIHRSDKSPPITTDDFRAKRKKGGAH
ncbi:hypothetical protein Bbelb_412760 [Branchiostoma belcheri]|nr:hypothetical protein Bbelb_412760 [Branchiostoma belcheri]